MFVERRRWRTIKYEEIYLHAYDGVGEAHRGIARYLDLYNAPYTGCHRDHLMSRKIVRDARKRARATNWHCLTSLSAGILITANWLRHAAF
jgi:hypothetical protein